MEVILAAAEEQGTGLFYKLKSSNDIRVGLEDLGVRYMQLVTSAGQMAIYRLELAEGGRSDLEQHFYGCGPGRFLKEMTGVLEIFIEKWVLRPANPEVTASPIKALCKAEVRKRRFLGMPALHSETELKEAARRAVYVFLRAYGSETINPVPSLVL